MALFALVEVVGGLRILLAYVLLVIVGGLLIYFEFFRGDPKTRREKKLKKEILRSQAMLKSFESQNISLENECNNGALRAKELLARYNALHAKATMGDCSDSIEGDELNACYKKLKIALEAAILHSWILKNTEVLQEMSIRRLEESIERLEQLFALGE